MPIATDPVAAECARQADVELDILIRPSRLTMADFSTAHHHAAKCRKLIAALMAVVNDRFPVGVAAALPQAAIAEFAAPEGA